MPKAVQARRRWFRGESAYDNRRMSSTRVSVSRRTTRATGMIRVTLTITVFAQPSNVHNRLGGSREKPFAAIGVFPLKRRLSWHRSELLRNLLLGLSVAIMVASTVACDRREAPEAGIPSIRGPTEPTVTIAESPALTPPQQTVPPPMTVATPTASPIVGRTTSPSPARSPTPTASPTPAGVLWLINRWDEPLWVSLTRSPSGAPFCEPGARHPSDPRRVGLVMPGYQTRLPFWVGTGMSPGLGDDSIYQILASRKDGEAVFCRTATYLALRDEGMQMELGPDSPWALPAGRSFPTVPPTETPTPRPLGGRTPIGRSRAC